MKTFGRYCFFSLSFLLWIAVLAGAFELWARWRTQTVARRNPFVLSRTAGAAWPIPDEFSDAFSPWLLDAEIRATYRGAGKSTQPLLPANPVRQMEQRLPFFLAYDAWERQVFANVHGMHVLLLDDAAAIMHACSVPDSMNPPPLSALLPHEDLGIVRNAMAELREANTTYLFAQPRNRPSESFGYCLAVPSVETQAEYGPSIWLFHRTPNLVEEIDETLWDVPFFLYRPHMHRRDHVNVLGMAEDFYVNNHGFRDDDLHLPKPPEVYRILCVGASTTEEGPTNALTYPAILEALLNRHFESNRFDVVNCGVSGMNSLKHRIKTADYLALAPDLIIIYNAVNDICHDLFPLWVNQAAPWQKRLRESRFINQFFNAYLLPDAAEMAKFIEQHKMADLHYVITQAAERGVPVAVCGFAAPDPEVLSRDEKAYYDHYTMLEWGGKYVVFDIYLRALDTYNNALRNLCRETGAHYIPVDQLLKGGANFFGDICHLRNAGIEEKAHIIALHLIAFLEGQTLP